MSRDRCAQCEEHAVLHRGNFLGFGPANARCEPCENHARTQCGRRPDLEARTRQRR